MAFVPELLDFMDAGSLAADRRVVRPDEWGRPDGLRPGALAPGVRIECVDARAMIPHQPAWDDLAARALESNVFLDPAFALPLLQHVRFEQRPDFLLAWEDRGDNTRSRLVGLLPITIAAPTRGPLPRFAWGYNHPQITLGTPLLDKGRSGEALAALLAWLGHSHPHLSTLILKQIPVDGAFFRLLQGQCAASGRAITLLDTHQRAILRHSPPSGSATVTSILSSKRRKELRRQRRRLAEIGSLSYRSATNPADLRRAAERFLALEAKGWKGRRGTALLADPTLATFTRTMTRLMAYEGRCRIDSLEVDGVPLAMGILIMAGSQAHFWKTTFDESYASRSPGVQFALELTAVQEADRGLTLTDSCAVPDHPMIDRIWDDRMDMADVMIDLRSGRSGGPRFARDVRLEVMRRHLRAVAKSGIRTFRRLRGSRDWSH